MKREAGVVISLTGGSGRYRTVLSRAIQGLAQRAVATVLRIGIDRVRFKSLVLGLLCVCVCVCVCV